MKDASAVRLPADTLLSWYRRIPKHDVTGFLSAFLAGLLTHFYMLVNKFPARDEVAGLFASRDRATSGRFLIGMLRRLLSDYSMPFVNGIAAITCIALCAALIVHILRIKKPLYAALVGASLAVFPTVGNFMTYMYTVDAVMLGLLVGVLGAFFIDLYAGQARGWRFLPIASILMALSIGTYQANITFVVALLSVRGLMLLLDPSTDGRRVFSAFLQFISALALSAVAYALLSKTVLSSTDRALDTYQGLSSAGFPTPARLMHLIARAYRNFWEFLFITAPRTTVHAIRYGNAALVGVSGLLILSALLFSVLSNIRRALAALFTLLLPLAFTGIYLFDPALVHILMLYSVVFFYVLPLALLSNTGDAARPAFAATAVKAAGYIAAFCVLSASYGFFVYTNQGVLSLQLKYENSFSFYERVLDAIERNEDYTPGCDVMFAGSPTNGNYPPDKSEYLDSFYSGVGFADDDNFWYVDDDKHIKYFIKYYLGVNLNFLPDETLSALDSSPAVAALPCYPEHGCISRIDNTLIVKLGNEED